MKQSTAAWKGKGKGKQSEEVTPRQEQAAKNILRLVWAGSLEQGQVLFKDLAISHPGLVDTIFFRYLLKQCSLARSPRAARWCFDRMLEAGVAPNLVTFNMFLDSCAKAGSLGLAEQWWCEMAQYGLKPSSVTYNIMINACAQGRNATRAEQWLEQMLKSNVRPSCVTFGTVVDSYAKLGNMEKAEAWAKEMQNHGFAMDRVIYNSLANACAKAGQPKRAEAWFQEMQDKGITPNEKAYNSIMQAWARAGKVENAEVWFRRLEQSGLKADEITFCSMIQFAAKLGNVTKVEGWMQAMIDHDFSPNTVCFNALLNLLARRGLSKKAIQWMKTLQESTTAEANAISFNCVVKACMLAGEEEEGGYWLREMITAGVHPDGSTLHALSSCPSKEGKVHESCEDPSSAKGAVVAKAYRALVQVYAQMGQPALVKYWLKLAQEAGFDLKASLTPVNAPKQYHHVSPAAPLPSSQEMLAQFAELKASQRPMSIFEDNHLCSISTAAEISRSQRLLGPITIQPVEPVATARARQSTSIQLGVDFEAISL